MGVAFVHTAMSHALSFVQSTYAHTMDSFADVDHLYFTTRSDIVAYVLSLWTIPDIVFLARISFFSIELFRFI